MPNAGSQVILCDLPIHFDTYRGCSHGCKYCFTQRCYNNKDIRKNETVNSLKKFIEGKRTKETGWVDWKIPIHWGGLSDPFQPYEKEAKLSLECLKLLNETQYPFVFSTKGKLIVEEPYCSLIKNCNCVIQISAVCSKYDKLEQGAPTYEERIEMAKKFTQNGKRVLIRIQPYMCEVLEDVLENMSRLKEAQIYGIIVEGMKFLKRGKGLEKVGSDFCYPKDILKYHFIKIKEKAHKNGLKFYCGENRLRTLGDNMCCCGIDGLEGFISNNFNLCHILNGDKVKPTEGMCVKNTGGSFATIFQDTLQDRKYRSMAFDEAMLTLYKEKKPLINQIFGK